MASENVTPDSNILHVFVIGFHHKRGCQVEYCYPALKSDGCTSVHDGDLPSLWSTLPSLALPDGAHNVIKDTVFFLLPSLEAKNECVYGISCYRQINSEDLICKSADVTRSTVQKSVCVLSRIPLFGVLNAKLELITQAYFNERDFSRVSVLAEMYNNLKMTLSETQLQTSAFIGLSAKEFLMRFKHKALVLFKLMLLEKRVLFHIFPVQKLTETILVLASLFPGMVERGLVEACNYSLTSNKQRIAQKQSQQIVQENDVKLEENDLKLQESGLKFEESDFKLQENDVKLEESNVKLEKKAGDNRAQAELPLFEEEDVLMCEIDEALNAAFPKETNVSCEQSNKTFISNKLWSAASNGWTVVMNSASGFTSPTTQGELLQDQIARSYSTLKTDQWGFPLSIFCKGSLFHPYLSLPFLDVINSDSVRSYVFGATNALFKQRKDLLDVIITEDDDGEMNIEIMDVELKKCLTLTTADLRFSEYMLKCVIPEESNEDIYEDTGWEGGDEWIRHQFNSYLLSLYATTNCNNQDCKDDFGDGFVQAWRTTHNFRVWTCGHYPNLAHAVQGHPFAGQLSVSDVKLRLSHSVHSSENGRKIAQTVTQTGKYIGQTGKQNLKVRSALGSWFSDLGSSVYSGGQSSQEINAQNTNSESVD